jgi:hypothetical protein
LLCEESSLHPAIFCLGSKADGEIVDLSGDAARKLWDAFDELAGFRETGNVAADKTLVPKDALRVTREVMEAEDVIGMGAGITGQLASTVAWKAAARTFKHAKEGSP